MGRYTLEIREIVESDNVKLFDFDYNFFDSNLKTDFEKLFIDYFYFREIGQETIGRFKKELQTKLNLIHHYYKEYYKTVQQVEIEEFMVTKDATDTFTRILEGESVANTQSIKNLNGSNSTLNNENRDLTNKVVNTQNKVGESNYITSESRTGENSSTSTQNNTTDNTNKFYDTPRNKINLEDSSLTNATLNNENSTLSNSQHNNNSENNTIDNMSNNKEDITNNVDTTNNEILSSNLQSTNNIDETSSNKGTQTNRTVETTILHSKGDLGVTSSGFLIQGWRDVITNIYQMIFDECEELFFQLF